MEEGDLTIDVTYDLQESAAAHGGHIDVETIRRLPDGTDALPIDVRESRALKPEYDVPRPSPSDDPGRVDDVVLPGGAQRVHA